jgi:tetratricopeptide (TPR) repeat protein
MAGIVSLAEAISEITNACSETAHRHFVFVVGAGISSPSIPLAAQITDDCRTIARLKQPTLAEPLESTASNQYSYWFHKAYPHAEQRREYLQELIYKHPLSPAAFRFAHILLQAKEKSVAKIVVTPNFDDFIPRSLTLLGETKFVVCDHPQTVDRIEPEEEDPIKIIHVHGSYKFYDLANTTGEIGVRAERPTNTTTSMANLLDRIFTNRSPIVIGYSGWESDVIMGALQRRLYDGENARPKTLGYNAYFFCYHRDGRVNLPSWLTSHPQVFFIEPRLDDNGPNRQSAPAPSGGGETIALHSPEIETPMATTGRLHEGAILEPVLPAEEILDRIITTLGIESPKLLSEPLGFFADQLEAAAPKVTEDDLYSLHSVIARIRKADALFKQQLAGADQFDTIETQLEIIRDALRQAKYPRALYLAANIDLRGLRYAQKFDLFRLISLATGLEKEPTAVIKGATLALTIADDLLHQKEGALTVEVAGMSADLFFAESNAQHKLGQWDDVLLTCNRALELLGDDPKEHIRHPLLSILTVQAHAFLMLDRPVDVLPVFDRIVDQFGGFNESPFRERVALMLVLKGRILLNLGNDEVALSAYDEVIRRFSAAPDLPLREKVAEALFMKGATLRKLGRIDEGIAAYDELLSHFAGASEPALREWCAKGLFSKGGALADMERREDALAAYDELVSLFVDAPEPAIREWVAKALISKVVPLSELGRDDDAVSQIDDVIYRFRDATDPGIREPVAVALFGKGEALAKLGRREEARTAFTEAINLSREIGKSQDAQIIQLAEEGLLKLEKADM